MTDDPSQGRLPSYVWIEAEVRRISATGAGIYIVSRGDRDSGLVLQKISDMSGKCRLLLQQRDARGRLAFMNALDADLVREAEADAYIVRARDRDPDLWVIEIEDKTLVQEISAP